MSSQPQHLAVMLSGELRNGASSLVQPNAVVGLSPLELYVRLQRTARWPTRAHLFACFNRPLNITPSVRSMLQPAFASIWAIDASSQFDRLLQCLLLVEARYPGRHSAFLRARPDMLMLGALPSPLFADPLSMHVKYRNYNQQHVGQDLMRDHLVCGMCDQWCECATRKYGGLFHYSNEAGALGTDRPGHCGVITDTVFLFGRALLPRVRRVLRAYATASLDMSFPPRAPLNQPEHCASAGVMVELGLQRLFDDFNISYRPLALRTALARQLQPDTPSWGSVACQLAWDAPPVPCTTPCVPPHSRVAAAVAFRRKWPGREAPGAPWMAPHCPMKETGAWAGCNPKQKVWAAAEPCDRAAASEAARGRPRRLANGRWIGGNHEFFMKVT